VPGIPKIKLMLMNATGTRVLARAHVKPTTGSLYHDFPVDPIWVADYAGTLKSTAKSFGGQVLAVRVSFDGNDFDSRCTTSSVTAIPVTSVELTIGNPL
jgi:hypothetical protein